jgi:transcriptional regulator with XRE-family HTH domain
MDADTIASICDKLAEGESLRSICRRMGIPESTARYWLRENGEHFPQYARARELQADSFFDAVIDIADDTSMTPEDRRIAIDARKWAAGKLNGKYSDKVKHVGGDDGDNPIAFTGFDIGFV